MIERSALLAAAGQAQAQMRTKLRDGTVSVHGMTCKPASPIFYACSLRVTSRRSTSAVVVIALRYDPTIRRGVIVFTSSSNERWRELLVGP